MIYMEFVADALDMICPTGCPYFVIMSIQYDGDEYITVLKIRAES